MDKKILILGSSQHSSLVTAYEWHQLPLDLNVAGYDIVILNFVPFIDKTYSEKIDLSSLPKISHFTSLLFHTKSEILVIGDPSTKIGNYTNSMSIDWWLPVEFKISPKFISHINIVDHDFAYYFQQVNTSLFQLDGTSIKPNLQVYFKVTNVNVDDFEVTTSPIAETSGKQATGFILKIQVKYTNTIYHKGIQKSKESGEIIWLPPTTKISNHDAINLILSERYGLKIEEVLPIWIENYKLPNQIIIEEIICNYINEINNLKSKLTIEQQKLKVEKRYHKLLYEQGVDGLEPIVREVLRELGATVNDPIKGENREDGLLEDPTGREAILEIKGRTKSLSLQDVRQLDQWVRDALFSDNPKDRKGIIIANMYCNVSLEQRKEPFPANCIDMAKQNKYCLLTTRQLYYAICLKQQNEFQETEFWDTIFNTDGVCSLPEI